MILTCKNLSVGYGGKSVADGINISVDKGDYVCIVGENGSGKTTFMKTVLSLIPAISGEIEFDESVKGKIGYLPQRTDVQKDFPASVTEIVLTGFQGKMGLRPFYTRAEKNEAQEQLERLGIGHLAKRCFRELSGGQQQRVLIARALCAAEGILLLDEPVSALDPKASEELYDCISALNKSGVAIMMITHDIDAAKKYAGKILKIGKTAETEVMER